MRFLEHGDGGKKITPTSSASVIVLRKMLNMIPCAEFTE
jgi:hypothetical protein